MVRFFALGLDGRYGTVQCRSFFILRVKMGAKLARYPMEHWQGNAYERATSKVVFFFFKSVFRSLIMDIDFDPNPALILSPLYVS